MLDIQTYLAAKSGKLPASSDMDMFSYLLGKSQSTPTKTITGVPPFTFKSNGDNLVDWSIKGNTGGVGERTKNLLSLTTETVTKNNVEFIVNATKGTVIATRKGTSVNNGNYAILLSFTSDTRLILSGCPIGGDNKKYNVYAWDYTTNARCKKWDGMTPSNTDYGGESVEVLFPANHNTAVICQIATGYNAQNVVFKPMLRLPDTSADFIPYGYEIPVTCGGKTTDIFIGDSPLGADDTITKTSTGVDIPTVNGSNTLSVDTTVQPSEMTITINRRLKNGV